MPKEGFTNHHKVIGKIATWAYLSLSIIYALTTVLGLISLKSPDDPISDPFFTIMELLIVLIAPLLVVIMVTIQAYASAETKVFGITALIFMSIMAGITSSVHFVILTVKSQFEASNITGHHLFISFNWPSIVYALDILAWDIFFALSMLFGAFVFKQGRLEKTVRNVMLLSGILSLLGLLGIPLSNMTIRNIGVVGYAFVAPVAFLLLTIVYGRTDKNL